MADFVYNIAKGRMVEFYNRVKSNDPANPAVTPDGSAITAQVNAAGFYRAP